MAMKGVKSFIRHCIVKGKKDRKAIMDFSQSIETSKQIQGLEVLSVFARRISRKPLFKFEPVKGIVYLTIAASFVKWDDEIHIAIHSNGTGRST